MSWPEAAQLTDDSTQCNNKHRTQGETWDPAWLPALIGNPSSLCWPTDFQGPVYNTATRVLENVLLPLRRQASFPAVSAGSSETREAKQSNGLGTKVCPRPQWSASSRAQTSFIMLQPLRWYVNVSTQRPSISASLCFHFWPVQADKHSSNDFDRDDKTNRPLWTSCVFWLLLCLAPNECV